MAQFHASSHGVLVSTDVAARGLDIPAVTHALQFDPPGETAEYVQRVGRTARMGRRGVALLFLAPSEIQYKDLLDGLGVPLTQQKLFPALAALPKPPALSKRAAAEADGNRAAFQAAMDAGHLCQVCSTLCSA
jgi:ATP-dependent RNA helicase DDX31/DBP7